MSRQPASLIILILFLVSTSSVTLDIQMAKASGTIYIRADGSIDPSTAPINRVGNVYTFTSSIYESIVVEANNIVIDGNGYTLQGLGSGYGFYLYGRNGVTIKNVVINWWSYGIELNEYSNGNILSDNTIANNTQEGIVLGFGCRDNTISGNNITNNDGGGITLHYCSLNTISGNLLTNNTDWGIELDYSGSNIISGNNMTNSDWYGIYLYECSGNTISGNNIINNTQAGISLAYSNSNTISGNNIINNTQAGIRLYSFLCNRNIISCNNISKNGYGIQLISSSDNKVYLNNFIDNTYQVYSEFSTNAWDAGYLSGGNFWSEYTDVDNNSGPYQNITGVPDGIWDHPYIINADNIDHYPLRDTTPPVADAGPNQTVNEDTVVTFDGSASTDENGIATYTWTFTDFTPKTLSDKNPTYVFAIPGTYTVTLEVADAAGNTATDTVTITVLDVTDPVANAGSDRAVDEDSSITLDGSGSIDNVGTTGYTWTFMDVTVKTLTGDKPAYTFSNPGVYTITLNVTDVTGNWATDTVIITVLDITEPIANAGQDQTVNVGETLTFDAGGSADNVGIISYEWDFGDGATGTSKTITHEYTEAGTHTVTLTVEDAAGNQAVDTMFVTVNTAQVFPWWIATAAAIAAAGIVAGIAILWRRRKKQHDDTQTVK